MFFIMWPIGGMYRLKRSSPRIDPCGTPEVRVSGAEVKLPRETNASVVNMILASLTLSLRVQKYVRIYRANSCTEVQ